MVALKPSEPKFITGEFSLGAYTAPGFLKFEPDQGQFEAVEKLIGIYRARGECDKGTTGLGGAGTGEGWGCDRAGE